MNGIGFAITAGATLLAGAMLAGLWWVGKLPTIQVILSLGFGYGLAQTFVGNWVGRGLGWAAHLLGHVNPSWPPYGAAAVALIMAIRLANDLHPREGVHRATVWVAMLLPSVLITVGGLFGLLNTVTSQIPGGS